MSESKTVSAASIGELVAEVKRLLDEGWQVQGRVVLDAETNLHTQAMGK